MRLDEIMRQPLLEMAYSKKKAESIITGLEDQINLHLIKLAVVAEQSRAEKHWRFELVTWLTKIARIVLKPTGKPAPASFYYRVLFDEPYGGSEVTNIGSQIKLLSRTYVINERADAEHVVERLRAFHSQFSKAVAAGGLTDEAIETMVSQFGGL